MANTYGLVGLRPAPEHAAGVASPPYDVEKMGSALHQLLAGNPKSLYHVILSKSPKQSLDRMITQGWLMTDEEPCYYAYEQSWLGRTRLGVLFSGEVSDYSKGQIIRHEKTFDEKVRDRVALKKSIGHHIGPVFLITRSEIGRVLQECRSSTPLYDFSSELEGHPGPQGIRNRVWRLKEDSAHGRQLQSLLDQHPLYIADGHHRYHAALKGGLDRFVGYATQDAEITAYNRVISGTQKFSQILSSLPLKETDTLATPPKHHFCIYSGGKSYFLAAAKSQRPNDVVARLDCSSLEKELYPLLGLRREMIQDPKHFDFYPEWAMKEMKAAVDRGNYDLAVALHPVSFSELMAVADAGLKDSSVAMPEKSTFFSPKVLSGIFLQRISS